MKKIEKSLEIGGKKLTISTGHIAEQADGAVLATYGETVVLATVVASELRDDPGYFPLTVEYQEKLFAGGIIKGSRWVKRDGRPIDEDMLTARLIDRNIRPLFPKGYKKDVQVIVSVLSVDLENPPDIPAGVAVSAALAASSIPWNGPVAMVKVGLTDSKFVLNPTSSQLENSEVDLIVSGTADAIVMIEAGAKEVDEQQIVKGIKFAQKESKSLLDLIDKFAKAVGNKKQVVEKTKTNSSLQKKVISLAKDKVSDLITKMATKEAGYDDYDEVKAAIKESVSDEERSEAGGLFDEYYEKEIRNMLLSGKRPDGRKTDQLRDISAEVSVLPRTHGSAIFNRGQTQALTVATLGASNLGQLIETAHGEQEKRYIHHYGMPPYSTGETGRVGSPKRREIGHGALAERALLPVIPTNDEFPYTIRVVTEILSSNGSTSMASACGSTLSLMDAGVPIKAPVAGIAMGLVIEDSKNYKVLTDIVGIEDGSGDMDFKVAGTSKGITALQMDVKSLKLTADILEVALKQGKKARQDILKAMLKGIGKTREQVSQYAPKIKHIKIDTEKIGEIIGPGGKIIKAMIAETGAQIDVSDDGTVEVSAIDENSVNSAIEKIEAMTKDVTSGELYDGEVKRIQPYGAFVEILPGKDGLVHISDMREDFVDNPDEVVKIGDKIKVRVKEVDKMGRINLSMLLDPASDAKKQRSGGKERFNRRDHNSRGNDRRGGGGYDRNRGGGRGRGRNDRPQRSRGGSGGPHFPTSRLLDDRGKELTRRRS